MISSCVQVDRNPHSINEVLFDCPKEGAALTDRKSLLDQEHLKETIHQDTTDEPKRKEKMSWQFVGLIGFGVLLVILLLAALVLFLVKRKQQEKQKQIPFSTTSDIKISIDDDKNTLTSVQKY